MNQQRRQGGQLKELRMAGKNVSLPMKSEAAKLATVDPIGASVGGVVRQFERLEDRPLDIVQDAAHAAVDNAVHPVAAIPIDQAAIVAPVVAAAVTHTIVPAQATAINTSVANTRQPAYAAMENTMKTAEEFVSFGQGNVEAMMKCGQIWAAGVQDMSKSIAATAQAHLDQTVSTWKALAGVKSIKEAMDLQSTIARSSVEAAVTETGKLTDASMKLAEQTMAPITARVTLAVEKFGRVA